MCSKILTDLSPPSFSSSSVSSLSSSSLSRPSDSVTGGRSVNSGGLSGGGKRQLSSTSLGTRVAG